MSTNNGNATRNKRRRTDGNLDGTESGNGGYAAAPAPTEATDPSGLGKRLLPIKDILASLPTELKDYIIPVSTEMVELVTTIRQRYDTYQRFDRPWVNPKTNEPYVDPTTDQPRPFIPNSLRKVCPIKASDAMKDDPDIQTALKEADEAYQKQLDVLALHAKKISKLEITTREKKLRKHFLDYCANFALGLVVTKQYEIGEMPGGSTLTRKELSLKAAFDALKDWSGGIAISLGYAGIDQLKEGFSTAQGFKDEEIEGKMSESDSNFLKSITEKLHIWIPKSTIDLWNGETQKENSRKANAELRAIFKPKAIAQATSDVQEELDKEDPEKKKIIAAAQTAARKEAQRVVQRANKSMRKKYLGDSETQMSTPTNSGTAGNGRSNTPRKKKRKTEGDQQQQQQPRSVLKKGRKVRFSTPTKKPNANSKGKGNANRGGAKGGGKKKGAGRR